jgi:hypothetical protein
MVEIKAAASEQFAKMAALSGQTHILIRNLKRRPNYFLNGNVDCYGRAC